MDLLKENEYLVRECIERDLEICDLEDENASLRKELSSCGCTYIKVILLLVTVIVAGVVRWISEASSRE